MSKQTKAATGAEEVTWDLSDLYAAVDDPAIERDLDEADARAEELAQTYRGRIAELDAEEMRDLLADSLGQLTEQERLVVALYYYEELTLKEIGQVLELSESRVSQLHTKAVLSLRVKLRKRFMA